MPKSDKRLSITISKMHDDMLKKISDDLGISVAQVIGLCLEVLKELAKDPKHISPKAKYVLTLIS